MRPSGNWDSSVCIAIAYGLDDKVVGVRVLVGSRIFSISRPALRCTQPPSQGVPEALSSGLMRPGLEADHSPSASAETLSSERAPHINKPPGIKILSQAPSGCFIPGHLKSLGWEIVSHFYEYKGEDIPVLN
jgi:hypothetical protein